MFIFIRHVFVYCKYEHTVTEHASYHHTLEDAIGDGLCLVDEEYDEEWSSYCVMRLDIRPGSNLKPVEVWSSDGGAKAA